MPCVGALFSPDQCPFHFSLTVVQRYLGEAGTGMCFRAHFVSSGHSLAGQCWTVLHLTCLFSELGKLIRPSHRAVRMKGEDVCKVSTESMVPGTQHVL